VHPERLYTRSEFEEKQSKLHRLRYEAVEKISSGLNAKVRDVFEKL